MNDRVSIWTEFYEYIKKSHVQSVYAFKDLQTNQTDWFPFLTFLWAFFSNCFLLLLFLV